MSSEPPQGDTATVVTEEPIRFRPGKKRKVYRQRDDTASLEPTASPSAPRDNDNNNPSDDDEEGRASAAAALRLRNARKARTGGVGFTATGSNAEVSGNAVGGALVVSRAAQDGENAVVQGITNRFTHQTGLVSSLNDKHIIPSLTPFRTHHRLPNR